MYNCQKSLYNPSLDCLSSRLSPILCNRMNGYDRDQEGRNERGGKGWEGKDEQITSNHESRRISFQRYNERGNAGQTPYTKDDYVVNCTPSIDRCPPWREIICKKV